MGEKESQQRDQGLRRIWESVTASVVGGLLLWLLTGALSQSNSTNSRLATSASAVCPSAPAPTEPAILPVAASQPITAPSAGMAPSAGSTVAVSAAPSASSASQPAVAAPANLSPSILPPMPATPAVVLAKQREVVPCSVPAGSILLFENFARYRDGDGCNWGPGTIVKTGLDHRNWLASNINGAHPVGCTARLPSEFVFECRYSADMPELTRGILGWWKDPVTSKIVFTTDQGVKHAIEWIVRYGNDPTKLNPIGSPSLCARRYYHTVKLPDGTSNEVAVVQPTGILRIERNKNVIKVLLDGQPAVTGTLGPVAEQLIGFQLDVVRAKSGALFFTDFKIAR